MSKSNIRSVIEQHGLKSGDTMRNVKGEEIPGSTVIDSHTFIHTEDGANGGFRLISERPIHGDEITMWMSADAIRAFQSVKID